VGEGRRLWYRRPKTAAAAAAAEDDGSGIEDPR